MENNQTNKFCVSGGKNEMEKPPRPDNVPRATDGARADFPSSSPNLALDVEVRDVTSIFPSLFSSTIYAVFTLSHRSTRKYHLQRAKKAKQGFPRLSLRVKGFWSFSQREFRFLSKTERGTCVMNDEEEEPRRRNPPRFSAAGQANLDLAPREVTTTTIMTLCARERIFVPRPQKMMSPVSHPFSFPFRPYTELIPACMCNNKRKGPDTKMSRVNGWCALVRSFVVPQKKSPRIYIERIYYRICLRFPFSRIKTSMLSKSNYPPRLPLGSATKDLWWVTKSLVELGEAVLEGTPGGVGRREVRAGRGRGDGWGGASQHCFPRAYQEGSGVLGTYWL